MPQTAPQIDFDASKRLANSIHDTIDGLFLQWGVPAFLRGIVAPTFGGIIFVVAFLVLVIMQVVIAIGAWVGASFLELIGKAREENKDAINELIAQTTNEMLGTNLTGGQLASGSGGAPGMDENQTIGKSLLSVLEEGFGASGEITDQQGADNAAKFLGFGINFAVSQGFLSILSEAASIGFLKEFHELPDSLRDSIGLGRLQRLAIQPLIQNCIQKPYTRMLQSQLRPTRLNEGQLVRAFHAGQLSQDELTTQLAQLGYRDVDIKLLISDLETKIAAGELSTLVRYGVLTSDQALQKLTDLGMDNDAAKLQLQAIDEAKGDGQVSGILSDLETARVDGFIDQGTFNKLVGDLPLSVEEQRLFEIKVGNRLERPRKTLTLAEVETAIVNGILDLSYFDTWMLNQGYGDDDQLALTFLLAEKMETAADKEAAKKWRREQLQAKGKPVPPWLQA